MLLPIIYFFKKLQYCYWADSWLFLSGVVRKLVQVIKCFQDQFEINLNICIFFTISICTRKTHVQINSKVNEENCMITLPEILGAYKESFEIIEIIRKIFGPSSSFFTYFQKCSKAFGYSLVIVCNLRMSSGPGTLSLEHKLKILVFHRMLGILKGIKLFFTIACVRTKC